MKAELDAKGCLVIRSESALESFALSHWWDLWQKDGSALRVETFEEVAFVQVRPTVSETDGRA